MDVAVSIVSDYLAALDVAVSIVSDYFAALDVAMFLVIRVWYTPGGDLFWIL